jgi:hypothetical protein
VDHEFKVSGVQGVDDSELLGTYVCDVDVEGEDVFFPREFVELLMLDYAVKQLANGFEVESY